MTNLPMADSFCPTPSDSPYWNESVWFSIAKPEIGMNGFIQYYFRPNMGMLNGGPVLWDGSGQYQWDCLYYNWSHLQGLPAGAEKFNMTARNSLSVTMLEPLTRYAIAYDKHGLMMDLVWEATDRMHELQTGDPGQQKTARFHIEQPGRLTGLIRLNGRDIVIDCFSMRDASYGPREYESLSSGTYYWGIAENCSFHAISIGEEPVQTIIGGYIAKDGVMASITAGTRRATEYGRLGGKACAFEATDTLGRTIAVTGKIQDGLVFSGYTDHTVVWSLCEWDWDGVTLWGENQEFCSTEKFRQIARGERAMGA